jgi:hypothetical protein
MTTIDEHVDADLACLVKTARSLARKGEWVSARTIEAAVARIRWNLQHADR